MRVGSDRWGGIVPTFARAESRDNVHMSYLANTANPNGVRFTPGETMSITDVSMPNKYAHNYIRLVVYSKPLRTVAKDSTSLLTFPWI